MRPRPIRDTWSITSPILALAGSMAELMPVLVDPSTPDPGEVERHPLAAQAQERLAPFWPSL